MSRLVVTAATPFRLGDRVQADGVSGVVVTVQDCGPDRQVLGVRQAGGGVVFVGVQVADGALLTPPVDLATATGLARLIMGGTDPRLPVAVTQNTLAAAVLMLSARLAGQEVP